jgi:hypothetical protein
MRGTLVRAAALWTMLCVALLAADRPAKPSVNDPPADRTAGDHQAMQGRWYREATNPQGAVFRIEKVIDGHRDTITHFDANGNTIHSHSGTFKLSLEGNVRIFTFSNITVTAGPNLGAQIPGPGSFAYKLEGDTLYEIQGLLTTDSRPLLAFAWKRIKNNP